MSQTLKTLKLAEVRPADDNLRSTPDQIRELADSIETVGLLEPPVVIKDGDTFKLVAGERRYRALELLGYDEAKFIVQTGVTEEQRQAAMLIENMQRVDLEPKEEAEGVRRLIQEHGFTQAEVAKNLGVSKEWVKTRIALLAVPDHVITGTTAIGHTLNLDTLAQLGELPADVREKLTKDGNVPAQHQIEEKVRQVANEAAAAKQLDKLRKDGILAVTFAELKKLIGLTDLTATDGRDFVIASMFSQAEDLKVEQYYSTNPRVPVPTVLLREILSHKISEYEWNTKDVYVLRKVGGYQKWHTAKLVMPTEESKQTSGDDWARERELRSQYRADVLDAFTKWVKSARVADLIEAMITVAVTHSNAELVLEHLGEDVVEADLSDLDEKKRQQWGSDERKEMDQRRQDAADSNVEALEHYIAKSKAHALRAALVSLVGTSGHDVASLRIELPEPPEELSDDPF